jgi:hypothetical protein
MSIKDFPKKIKSYWTDRVFPIFSSFRANFEVKEDVFIVLVIILVGLAGFGLGKLSALEKGREPVKIKPAQFTAIISNATTTHVSLPVISPIIAPASAAAMIAVENAKGLLVAAKGGTKYYFPWCSGVSRIKEENMVWFDSYEQAQMAGYSAAANCPNLK